MKFIHTADLHLDSPLRGLSDYPDAPAQRLRTATREAFENLVTLAIDEAVDFMVIAGDLYDGDWRDFNTGLYFIRQMGRLRQAGIPVYLLYGNHDAESEMTKSIELPDNVQVFPSRKPASFRLEAHRVVLHGQSFREAATTDNLVPAYPAPVPGWFNIGVLHTALEGNAEHARYAPCTLGELQAKGYQYWALGHVHAQWVQQEEAVTVAWPGNLQGRHIRESGPRAALCIQVEEGRITTVQPIETAVLRWAELKVDVSKVGARATGQRSALLREVGRHLATLLEDTPASLSLAVRVILTGATCLHRELIGMERALREEIIAQALMQDADRLWIEKVRLETTPLNETSTHREDQEDMADVLTALNQDAKAAMEDAEFIALLQQDLQALLAKMPHEALAEVALLREMQLDPLAHLPQALARAGEFLRAKLENPTVDAAEKVRD